MWDEIAPTAQAAHTRQQLGEPVTLDTQEAGITDNFFGGAGSYFMRSLATAGRAASMAVAAVPSLIQAGADLSPHADPKARRMDDAYFRWHDDIFGNAVDAWTPKPGEVGAAGEVVGSVAGGVLKFVANPALAVADAQLSTGEDLIRQGVSPGAAQVVGGIAAVGTIAGMKIPVLGNTLGQRVATGVVGNLAQGAATAGASAAVLSAAGADPRVVAQFNPFDLKARAIDALLGAAFGGLAHAGARSETMTQTQRDAIATINQARHIEEAALPSRPATEADLSAAVEATRTAIGQVLRGEPVAVEGMTRDIAMEADPVKEAERAEIARVVAEELPAGQPIERPPMQDAAAAAGDGAPRAPVFDDSVRIPAGFDPRTGETMTMPANEFIARAQADVERAKTHDVALVRTAASCLLGAL
jgi:hypothetical protein